MRLKIMLTLAFDTTQGACSAAISQEGRLLAHAFMPMERGHAEHLLPTIEQVRRQAKISYGDLELIAVTIGPGTFTGVRVGLAAAPALAPARASRRWCSTDWQSLAACVRMTMLHAPCISTTPIKKL